MVPSFGALLCLKVLWTWRDEEKWTLLRDSITVEQNAAAHWPFFRLPFLFSSRCQSLGMLDIRAGIALKQTQQYQHVQKEFLSAIKAVRNKGKSIC